VWLDTLSELHSSGKVYDTRPFHFQMLESNPELEIRGRGRPRHTQCPFTSINVKNAGIALSGYSAFLTRW
jgi:hypothetical protein